MELAGTVRDGVVVLDKIDALPEGTRVSIVPIPSTEPPSLYDRMKHLFGSTTGLPADASQRIDHYLTHGLPDQ